MSEWKEQAAKRRDERHDKSKPTEERTQAKRKDTARWCKGKVGQEHQWARVRKEYQVGDHKYGFTHVQCERCGKGTYNKRITESLKDTLPRVESGA